MFNFSNLPHPLSTYNKSELSTILSTKHRKDKHINRSFRFPSDNWQSRFRQANSQSPTNQIRKHIFIVTSNSTNYTVIDTYKILIRYNIIENSFLAQAKAKRAWNEFLGMVGQKLKLDPTMMHIYSIDGKISRSFQDISGMKVVIAVPNGDQFKGISRALYESLAFSKSSLNSITLRSVKNNQLKVNKIATPLIKIKTNRLRGKINRVMNSVMIDHKICSFKAIQLKAEFLCLDKEVCYEMNNSYDKMVNGVPIQCVYSNILLFGGKSRDYIKTILEKAGILSRETARITFEEYVKLRLNIEKFTKDARIM